MSSRGVETAIGLARWSDGLLELDLSSIDGVDSGLLKLQLINGNSSTASRVSVSPISNTIDEDRSPMGALARQPAVTTFPMGIDIGSYRRNDAMRVHPENSRFDSVQKLLTTEFTLQNMGSTVGRDVVLAFPNLPSGVTLRNASGVSSQSGPFIHLKDVIRRGGLVADGSTERVELTFANPQNLLFDSSPIIWVGENNVSPTFPSMGPFNMMPGETLAINLPATDPNGDLITYSLESDGALPGYELFASGSLTFKPSPLEIGTYRFTVIATDGVASTPREVTLNVNSDPITTTRLSGRVLDVDGTPIAGLRVEVGAVSGLTRTDGRFELDLGTGVVPSETIRIRGELMQGAATYPFIAEKLPFMLGHDLYSGFNNHIVRPIYLPKLDMANSKTINPATNTVVTTSAIAGEAHRSGQARFRINRGLHFRGDYPLPKFQRNLLQRRYQMDCFPILWLPFNLEK